MVLWLGAFTRLLEILLIYDRLNLLLLVPHYFVINLGLLNFIDERRVGVLLIGKHLIHRPADVEHYQQDRIFLSVFCFQFVSRLHHHPRIIAGKSHLILP